MKEESVGCISPIPWKRSPRGEERGQPFYRVLGQTGGKILEAMDRSTSYGDDNENTTLAAAAPDLLAILKLLTEMVRTDSARGRLAKKIFDQTMGSLSKESRGVISTHASEILNEEFGWADPMLKRISLPDEDEPERGEKESGETDPKESCSRWESVRPRRERVRLSPRPKSGSR